MKTDPYRQHHDANYNAIPQSGTMLHKWLPDYYVNNLFRPVWTPEEERATTAWVKAWDDFRFARHSGKQQTGAHACR